MMKVEGSKNKKELLKVSLRALTAGLAVGTVVAVATPITVKADLVEEEVTSEGKPKYEDVTPEDEKEHDSEKPNTQDGDAKVDNSKGGEENNQKPQDDGKDINQGITITEEFVENPIIEPQVDEYAKKTKKEEGKPVPKTGRNTFAWAVVGAMAGGACAYGVYKINGSKAVYSKKKEKALIRRTKNR